MTYCAERLTLTGTKVLLDIYERDQRRGYRSLTATQDGYTADDVDFTDNGTRDRLARQGLFSIDQAAHRAKRDAEAAADLVIQKAYDRCRVDRRRAYGRIASRLEATLTSGIWARSTWQYASARDALDRLMVAQAALVRGPDIRIHDHGSIVVVELVSDEAKAWVRDNVEVPDWAWMGLGIAVEPRLVDGFVEGARNDGLELAA